MNYCAHAPRLPVRLAAAAAAAFVLAPLAAAADRPQKVLPAEVGVEVEVVEGKPQPSAEREKLFRRLVLDALGRTPTEKEVADFVADGSPTAYRDALERLQGKGGGGKEAKGRDKKAETADKARAEREQGGEKERADKERGDKERGEKDQAERDRASLVARDRAAAERQRAEAAERKAESVVEQLQRELARGRRQADEQRAKAEEQRAKAERAAIDAKLQAEQAHSATAAAQANKSAQADKAAEGYRQYVATLRKPVAPGDLSAAYAAVTARKAMSAAYLGVSVGTPDETLRAQLELPEGAGLVVNHVDGSGPTQSLVRQHDVLRKLDDQILVNGEQLVALVRLHKPGETVEIGLIRGAKPTAVTVKLGERQVQVGQGDAATTALSLVANYNADLITNTPVVSEVPVLSKIGFVSDAFKPAAGLLAAQVYQAGPIRVDDGMWAIELSPAGGEKAVRLSEAKTGKIVYDGPAITSEDDPHAGLLPPDARQKLITWQKALVSPDAHNHTLLLTGGDGGRIVVTSPATRPAAEGVAEPSQK